MKNRIILIPGIFFLAVGLLFSNVAFAEEPEKIGGDDSMRVLQENERPDEFQHRISLPETAAEAGVENSAHGLDTANEARRKGPEFGSQKAREAREMHNEELREQVRERAQDRIRDQAREQARQSGRAPNPME